ncbi:MAG: DNA polymerase III subunit delta [Bacteroidetes bacterium]|nr:DNA polymerase III subunit delta [Bacteroidota bacterium]
MFPAYLLLGPETGQKSQHIKTIREECRSTYGETPEIHRFYPFETENGEILLALQNHSLFAAHRLVILSQADLLNASMVSILEAYLKKPSDSSTLILVSSTNRIAKKLESQISGKARVVFWEMFENKKREWLVSYFKRQKLEITDDAIELILELVENNTYDLRVVCGQFSAFFLGQDEQESFEITEVEVEQFMYHSRKENVFSLFSFIAQGDLKRSLEVFRTLHRAGEAEPPSVFAGLLWQFRRFYSFVSLLNDGRTEEAAFRNAYVMGKDAKITGKKNQQIYREGAANYSMREIAQIIASIGEYDCAVRELGTGLKQIMMEKFLYECILKKGRKSVSFSHYCASFIHS